MKVHVFERVSRLVRGVSGIMADWSSRRELANLDDRMLQDLGISRAQAEFEAHRAPWIMPAAAIVEDERPRAAPRRDRDRGFAPLVSRF